MNTDPVKKIGRIQEQIAVEQKSRRNYSSNWSKFYNEAPWNAMYNQNEINKQLKTKLKDLCPYVYTGEGDSYFLSPEMYKNLVTRCRCDRSRTELHLTKCLQKQQQQYSIIKENEKEGDTAASERRNLTKIPETTNGFVGWQVMKLPNYKQWENSMKYISPMYDMPGEKITAKPYNAIIIG